MPFPAKEQLTRRTVLTGMALSALAGGMAPGAGAQPAAPGEEQASRVPLDHLAPDGESFSLRYGLLTPFDPRKQTVFVVADGQQFYVTPNAFARNVGPLFAEQVNVVGVFGRADAPEVQARTGAGASVDWAQAYRLLRAEQWIGDLDAVRRALLGPQGRIGLYGRSGGAFLAHQYVARHGRHVDRLFTQAAVNPFIEARFGLTSDHFWDQLGPDDRARLSELLVAGRYPRDRIAQLFQRQNFFVARDGLAAARSALIADLGAGAAERIAARESEYQIDALADLGRSPRGPAIHVRLFEFYAPVAAAHRQESGVLRPDLEVSARFAEPLMRLLRSGRITMPAMDFEALHTCPAEVFMVAGRWDHTCDYRSQIALASCYPRGQLALLDDDHVFHRLRERGLAAPLVRAFFGDGADAAMTLVRDIGWREA